MRLGLARMGKSTGVVAVAFAVGALGGCGDPPETTDISSNPPIGTFVSTKDWNGEGSAFAKPVPVTIGNARVEWSGACNGYEAKPVRITPDRLDFSEATILGSLVGCEAEGQQRQEDDLETFFSSSPEWSLDGNRLTLSTGSVEVVLQRDDAPPDS